MHIDDKIICSTKNYWSREAPANSNALVGVIQVGYFYAHGHHHLHAHDVFQPLIILLMLLMEKLCVFPEKNVYLYIFYI